MHNLLEEMIGELGEDPMQNMLDGELEALEETPNDELNKAEVLQELLERFRNAETYRRQYDQIATRCYKLYRAYQRVSTHAPLRGATTVRQAHRGIESRFNPRTPAGCDSTCL